MSLLNLQSILQKQVTDSGSITVSEATLREANLVASPGFDTIVQSYLQIKEPLHVAMTTAVPPPVSNQLSLYGMASFLAVSGMQMQVIFTLETDNTINVLLIATLPAKWNFSASFPGLNLFPFTKLEVTQPQYLLTTAKQQQYNWNDQTLTVKQGLNYASYLTMNGPLGILEKIISTLTPTDKAIFTGTIDTTLTVKNEFIVPGVSLTGSVGKDITANTHLNLSVPEVLITTEKDDNGFPVYWLSFSSTLSVDGHPFSVFQAAIIEGSSNLMLSMGPCGHAITPLQIVNLLGGEDYRKYIPSVISSIFDAVSLKGLYAAVNTKPFELQALSIAIGTTSPWTMGKFVVKDITLNCQMLMPFTDNKSTLVIFSAKAEIYKDIFKGEFDFEIDYDIENKQMTLAAGFEGQVHINDLIHGLSKNITVPESFGDIEFDNFGMTFTEENSKYEYTLYGSAKGTFNIKLLDSPVVATFEVNIDSASQTYTLIGGLTLGNSFFQATANLSGGKQVLSGSWAALKNEQFGIKDILTALNFTPPDIPPGLDLGLKSASITYDLTDHILQITAESANYGNAVFVAFKNTVTTQWQFYFGVEVDKAINLSNLPLINKVLPDDEKIEIKKLQILLSSAPLDPNKEADKKEIALINGLIPSGYAAIPAEGLPGKIAVSAQFNFGGFIIPLSIGTAKKQAGALPGPGGTSVGNGTGNNSAPVPPPAQSADGATWFDIQKNFGPVNFQKVGVKYEDGVLWFLINASLTAAGLGISVIGLAVGSPLSTFKPEFNIEGLGIDFSNSAVTIKGAFVKLPAKDPVTLEFGGTATIQLKTFGISAIGAYAQFSGQTSMFVFASVNGPFGGPAFFYITGFCGGFGYNSKLRIPEQNEVYQFPFVASLQDPDVLGNNPTPTDVLQKVMGGDKPWVTPSVGDIWLAAGIKFTTFEVVNSTALLIAEFGNKFLLALVGLSKAQFPMEGTTIYAYVELQLEALFDPGDGVMSFTAVLSPNSFLLDKNCHLTGGFAFVFWFGPSPNAGDFVLTLGGYSPYYSPPDYYPKEPRLGFNWAVDTTISISGGLYFALTPGAIMAGGSLDAVYQSGNLKAWFNAHADIIIWYNPFHFKADVGISIGASYKLDFGFCTKTLTVELGADLTLWGPETGGTATIHWFIISFTVRFGADPSSTLEKQTWNDFIKVLPAPGDAVKFVPLAGLTAAPAAPGKVDKARPNKLMTAKEDDAKPWLVRADSFQFTSDSSIPITEVYIGANTTPVKKGDALNIKPMQETGLISKKRLSIINKETGNNVLDDTWDIEIVAGNVPSALWGTGSSKELSSGPQLIPKQLTGLRVKVPSPILGGGTGDINIKEDLQYDPLEPGKNPLQLGLKPQGPLPAASDTTIAEIEKIMSATIKGERDKFFGAFAAFNLDGLKNGDLTSLEKNAGSIFVNEPLLTKS